MRITRLILVLAFLVVAAAFTLQNLAGQDPEAGEPPVLHCGSEVLDISVQDDDSVLLSGITAEDAQDGDLTDKVLISGISRLMGDGTAKVTYAVFDSHHNMATLTRRIRYTDYRLPRFSLEEPLIYRTSQSIRLLDRLHAHDVIDGDITNSIRVTSTATASDVYQLSVQVTNSMGDTAWLTLPVIMLEDDAAVLDVELSTYLVYLEQGSEFSAGDYLEQASLNGDAISRDNVTVTGTVDTAVPGTYILEYTCTYGSLSGTAYLTVVVE